MLPIIKPERVLILAPHTDDGEFGCGGTIARLIEEGYEVYYVAFSTCETSIPDEYPKNILRIELSKAMQTLGIPDRNVIVFNYPVRKFNEYRQDILEDLIKIERDINPSIVFAPSVNDIHQDHGVVSAEAKRAFKKKTLFAYELPWNNFTFMNQVYFRLKKEHIDKKIDAIACYETQSRRPYAKIEFTIGQATVHGVQIGCDYAEVFEAVRDIY